MEMEKCACKGIRKCKLCDTELSKEDNKIANQWTFYYKSLTKCANLVHNGNYSFEFPGVVIIENFINAMEEENLIKNIDSNPWKMSQSGRLKQDFGPKVNFKKKKLKLGTFQGLPVYVKNIINKFKNLDCLKTFQVVELCNLHYSPERGSSIDPHFDDFWLWGERLVTLNLKSDTWLTMTCDNHEILTQLIHRTGLPNTTTDKILVKIPLKQRSLVVLFGDARYKWKHEILREDITDIRQCCTFRELSEEFLTGLRKEEGSKLINIALSYNGVVTS